jgi:hypothetical protein
MEAPPPALLSALASLVLPASSGGGSTASPAATPKAATPAPGGIKMGEPKVKEEGMRWVVEFHTKDTLKAAGTQMLTVGGASLKQEVYIYGCKCVGAPAEGVGGQRAPRRPARPPPSLRAPCPPASLTPPQPPTPPPCPSPQGRGH